MQSRSCFEAHTGAWDEAERARDQVPWPPRPAPGHQHRRDVWPAQFTGVRILAWALACAALTSACGEDAQSGDAAVSDDTAADVELEALQIEVGALSFDATAAGPEQGELVLLLHGFPETSYQWQAQQRALASAGFRAVAPDQRGYSAGARPAEVDEYAIPLLVADVVGMADALGRTEFHVVGHDWGGAVAWAVAALFPDRVKTVSALSMPHPQAFAAALSDMQSCQYAASAYFDALSSPDSTVADLGAVEGTGFDQLPPASLMHYSEHVLNQPEVFQAALNWYRANAAQRMLAGADVLGATKMPTLYIWGTADVTFCRDTAEDTENFVEGEYTFIPAEGAGHWLSELNGELVSEALLMHLDR